MLFQSYLMTILWKVGRWFGVVCKENTNTVLQYSVLLICSNRRVQRTATGHINSQIKNKEETGRSRGIEMISEFFLEFSVSLAENQILGKEVITLRKFYNFLMRSLHCLKTIFISVIRQLKPSHSQINGYLFVTYLLIIWKKMSSEFVSMSHQTYF